MLERTFVSHISQIPGEADPNPGTGTASLVSVRPHEQMDPRSTGDGDVWGWTIPVPSVPGAAASEEGQCVSAES